MVKLDENYENIRMLSVKRLGIYHDFETQGSCHQKFKTRVSVAPQVWSKRKEKIFVIIEVEQGTKISLDKRVYHLGWNSCLQYLWW